jgi:hypothetical protein
MYTGWAVRVNEWRRAPAEERTFMDKVRRNVMTAVTLGLGSTAVQPADPADVVPVSPNSAGIDDVRRYGIVANDPDAAHANTLAMKRLCSPEISAHGFVGRLRFSNITGADTYFFDDIITFRDGISLDLQNCTLNFRKDGPDPHAADAGFIYAVRNFTIENGTIDVHYPSAGDEQGSAIAIGSRGAPGAKYFPNFYEKLLPFPQGNICIRNLHLTSDNPKARLILAMGGLQNVSFENLFLDGKGVSDGIYYEFGWQTNESTVTQRQTSHAHNLRFVNVVVNNLRRSSYAAAIATNGAYSVLLDGISVSGAYCALCFGTGESLFYRPAVGIDDAGAKRNIRIRNLVAQDLTGTAVELTGANLATGGYLRSLRLGPPAQTDLLDCSIDGFAINDAAGYGIRSSAGRLVVSNGRISNCQRGIVTTDECTWFSLSDVAVLGNAEMGIQIGQSVHIYDPPREKLGVIRNCFIAGNGANSPVTNAGIVLSRCRGVIIENNRFGYERKHDGREETTQGSAVSAGADTFAIRCVGNYVAGTAGTAPAYDLSMSGAHGRGCTIEHAGGTATRAGLWGDGLHQLEVLALDAVVTPNCQFSNEFLITLTDSRDLVIAAPLNPTYGRRITITIGNVSKGNAGTPAWQSAFKMAAWENPRTGHSRSIEFMYTGTDWLEVGRTPQDVPN